MGITGEAAAEMMGTDTVGSLSVVGCVAADASNVRGDVSQLSSPGLAGIHHSATAGSFARCGAALHSIPGSAGVHPLPRLRPSAMARRSTPFGDFR